jgi:hypothetical protein
MNKQCPSCGRTDAKAGAVWGCSMCSVHLASGFRWWDLPGTCELCVDPVDKPHIDEHGTKRWRPCLNLATRQVLQRGKKEWVLNICEEHFAKEAS